MNDTRISSVSRVMIAKGGELRHHLAMLRKCQRCLHLAEYKDGDVEEIQKSIDFVVNYCKNV
jgi:hypothetical protein